MSDDLPARLRLSSDYLDAWGTNAYDEKAAALLREAADEIERLRQSVGDERDKAAHGLRQAGDVVSGWRVTFKK